MDRAESILVDPTTGLPIGTTAGALDVNATFGGVILVSVPSVGATGAAVPAQADQVGGPDAAGLLRAQRLYDVDSGAGSEFALGVSLRKTANGGSVEAGTLADPLRTDPTGTTSQPTTNPTQLPASLGQKLMAASLAVTLASDQSALAVTAGSLPLPTGAATEVTLAAMSAKLPAALVGGRLDENVGAWMGSTAPTVGSKVSASSLPVVIASDQGAVPVSATQLPAALVGGRLDENVGAWGGTATTLGSKVSASSVPVVIASDQGAVTVAGGKTNNNAAPGATNLGALVGVANAAAPTWTEGNEVLVSTDLSGAMRTGVSNWLSSTAPTVGQKTMANSIPVAIASDQDWVGLGGGAIPSRSIFVGGSDGANMRNFRFYDLDSGAGTQFVQGVNLRLSASGGSVEAQGQKTMAASIPVVWPSDFVPGNVTYRAAISGLLSDAAGATDIFSIFGSGTKTIYIMRIAVSATATAGVNTTAQLRKLSTVLTGGTSAAMTAVPNDSASAAATATPLSWTVSPTGGGTLVGIVGTTKLNIGAPATVTGSPSWVWKFGGPGDSQPIVLRGTTQGLTLNLNGAVLAGSSFNIEVEFTEA